MVARNRRREHDPPFDNRAFHRFNEGDPLYLFVFTQFLTENRFTLFLELLLS